MKNIFLTLFLIIVYLSSFYTALVLKWEGNLPLSITTIAVISFMIAHDIFGERFLTLKQSKNLLTVIFLFQVLVGFFILENSTKYLLQLLIK